jgi:hypothetical protein
MAPSCPSATFMIAERLQNGSAATTASKNSCQATASVQIAKDHRSHQSRFVQQSSDYWRAAFSNLGNHDYSAQHLGYFVFAIAGLTSTCRQYSTIQD